MVSYLTAQRPECRASVRFTAASLLVFATVAFGQRWMYQHLSLIGAYSVWTLLFILFGGLALKPLVVQPGAKRRFWLWFGLAFFVYAASWMASYFTLRGVVGEWLGSLSGSAALAAVIAGAFGVWGRLARILMELLVTHSAAYFFGEWVHHSLHGRIGMLLWGISYGLGLGFGLARALYLAQTLDVPATSRSAD